MGGGALFFVGGDCSSGRIVITRSSGSIPSVDGDDEGSFLFIVLERLPIETLFWDLLVEEGRGDSAFSYLMIVELKLEVRRDSYVLLNQADVRSITTVLK